MAATCSRQLQKNSNPLHGAPCDRRTGEVQKKKKEEKEECRVWKAQGAAKTKVPLSA